MTVKKDPESPQKRARKIIVTEADLREQIRDLCKLFGWKMYFSWLSMRSPRGFPDLVLCRPPRLVFAELKSDKGKVREDQALWLTALLDCSCVEVYVWRPVDIEDIVRVLRGD